MHDSFNSYTTPVHASEAPLGASVQTQAPPPRLASRGQRLANYVIDGVVYMAACAGVGIFLGIVGAIFGFDPFVVVEDPVGERVFGSGVYVLFYVIFEQALGQTPGKMVTGTRIVSEDGSKPTATQLLTRSAARLIPFEPFSVFKKNGVMWHDSISKTRVVCDEPLEL